VAPSTDLGNRLSIFKDFGIGAQILRDIGVGKIRWLTNNPRRLLGLPGYGLEIAEWVPLTLDEKPAPAAPRPAKVLKLR
jgi:GTP cyclohydrolase II